MERPQWRDEAAPPHACIDGGTRLGDRGTSGAMSSPCRYRTREIKAIDRCRWHTHALWAVIVGIVHVGNMQPPYPCVAPAQKDTARPHSWVDAQLDDTDRAQSREKCPRVGSGADQGGIAAPQRSGTKTCVCSNKTPSPSNASHGHGSSPRRATIAAVIASSC